MGHTLWRLTPLDYAFLKRLRIAPDASRPAPACPRCRGVGSWSVRGRRRRMVCDTCGGTGERKETP